MPAKTPSPTAAVLLHGAGSSPRFVLAAFGGALRQAGVQRIEAPWDRTGDVDHIAASVVATLGRLRGEGYRVAFVGGVSVGAHAAAAWAAAHPDADSLDGLLLALPAWTGEPDAVAAATGSAAEELDRFGVDAVIARLRTDPALADDWVLEQLATDWPRYPPGSLPAALRRVAAGPGPGVGSLGSIPVPCGVVALDEDPLHPAEVAATWARLVPRGALRHVGRQDPAVDLAVIGRAAMAAWHEAAAVAGGAHGTGD